ncbi:MAG: helix-turn-helix transcriptional regulator [Bacteroidales bacterium]|jgi:transcriptional regulator with XRE-family HTH domain|nr:helix-turn-helix transcriptional regulator [Bacteroidales bacterium]
MRPKKATDIYKEIGEQIKARREEKGLSQAGLGEIMGVHRNNIGEAELGKRGMSLDTLAKYCKALDLEIKLEKKD